MMNLLLRLLGCWVLLQSAGLSMANGQEGPQWLFAADRPGQQAYHLAYIVGGQTGAWSFSETELVKVVSAFPEEKPSDLRVSIDAGAYGAEQEWGLRFLSDTLQTVANAHAKSWIKAPGTKGLVYDTTRFELRRSSTAASDTLRAFAKGLKDTSGQMVRLDSRDHQSEYAWLLNVQGWPVAEVQLLNGALVNWQTYHYEWDQEQQWQQRLVHDRLSGQRQWVSRRVVQKGKIVPGGWMAVSGGAGYWLLVPNGQARYWDGQRPEPLQGTWRSEENELIVQRPDQRQPFRWKKEVYPWGWRVETAEGRRQDWVWRNALGPVPRKLKRWGEMAEAAHYETYESKSRAGLRTTGGRVMLPAQYDAVEAVHPGFAIVELEERFGLVQTGGTALLPIYFEKLQYLGDSLLLAQRSGAQGILHLNGDTLVPFAYERLIPYTDSSYWAFSGGQMGLIDARGTTIAELRFDLVHPFYGNQAMAILNGQTGIIDKKGQWIVQPGKYDGLSPVALEGYLVQTADDYRGFMGRDGQLLIEPVYRHLRPLATGVLVAQQDGRFGLIRTTGELLVPLEYRMLKGCGDYSATDELCQALAENRAVAQYISDDSFGYLDALGRTHPPMLPSAAEIEANYQKETVEEGLRFVFSEKWKLESSIQKLYKQGDYGQSRVVYEYLPANGQPLEAWIAARVDHATTDAMLGGRKALAYTERERVRYYDFFRKHIYCLSGDGQTIIHLEFSCKDANFLESIPDLYEIEQLIRFVEERE